ncbi:autotransporter domain-containing protein [Brevundimonas sp.]|uniref:autotransporter domain-containing protein n=1 Tax=Brevundimonas sp. TaxID=1871086 RepID=UPI002C3F4B66|nr:autotransporter domain-containing protein [Brevundimonas sp.]HWQ86645.1 autotransporter domain-containing protein [Brevundimonas sp.]
MNNQLHQKRAGLGLKDLLRGSVAGLCLAAAATPALAQSGQPGPAQGGFLNFGAVERAPQIVIANPGTPTTARDPVNVTGVGQMIIDQQNGFIGLCTATLINPRTVIFAAHCVNERAANAYGAGGTPIGFGFSSNNNAAGNSAFGGWLGNHQTNTSRFMYNSNHVAYHPASLEPEANSFLYGDVAIASLDTVARDVPSWSMLFSALPAPTITAAGTGYHVNLSGYGNNGTGTTGSTGGIDFRRRLAENMLGGLASIDEFESFLFGSPGGDLPQNVYWIDFDDPRRGTAQASPFDFNAWRDNALPREGITASGDSGGPLILDNTFSKPVVIGVLSGGYTRFFNGQPANGYGTASFFQPLYLYWDWIAANNPYHYVSALAGDGNWTDASHWVTSLDPNYQIIGPDGQLVNGVPTDVGAGPTGPDANGFGQMCFQSGGVSDCVDVATGVETIQNKPIGAGASSGAAVVSVDALLETGAGEETAGAAPAEAQTRFSGESVGAVREAQAGLGGSIGTAALPAATLLNGLPGARNFVPVNFEGDRLAGAAPRYFDVTLSANGTTTLSTAVTIDRLTMAGVGAGLNITGTGDLFSNIDITQLTGTLHVDGALRTPGDFFMMTGGLSGSGAITTPFFTNMAGVIAPGTPTTIGTLTFNGDVILASGGALLINLGASGSSDRLVVTGQANLGGLVTFGFTPGTAPRFGDSYTFLTAAGGVSGTFSDAPITAILRPTITYLPTSVRVQIAAGLYADVVTSSPIQAAYARLLDQNRVAYAGFSDLYGPLDVQSADSIQATLEALAPRTETLKTSLGVAAMDSMASFYRERLTLTGADMDGSLQVIGRPVDYASVAMDSLDGGSVSPLGETGESVVVPDVLPDGLRAFVAAGYLDGEGAPMSTATGGGKDSFDGYFIAAGVEAALGRQAMLGLAVSTTELSGSTAVAPQSAEGRLFLGTAYANWRADSGLVLNGMFSFGEFDTETTRLAAVGPGVFTLKTSDGARAMAGEIGLGFRTENDQVSVTPGASLRASKINYGPTTETGGGPALQYQRESADALEGRLGLTVSGRSSTFRPYASAAAVHAFADPVSSFGANFVGGVGPDAVFALGSQDRNWIEVGVGLEAIRDVWRFTVAAETTLSRDDVENRSVRAAASIRF